MLLLMKIQTFPDFDASKKKKRRYCEEYKGTKCVVKSPHVQTDTGCGRSTTVALEPRLSQTEKNAIKNTLHLILITFIFTKQEDKVCRQRQLCHI